MLCRLNDLKNKFVINVRNGCRLGTVYDAEMETASATVRTLLIRGRLRLFGLLGREPDITVNWSEIEVIGEDTILVSQLVAPEDEENGPKGHGLFHILTEE